jgi:homoserine kinase type II
MVMKLTKKEIKKIAENYNLGKVKSFSLMEGGLKNFNYELKTEKGDFVVRLLFDKLNLRKRKALDLEFKTLKFLEKNNFPYQIPLPLENKYKNLLSRIKNKNYWVYRKIKGDKVKEINSKQFKEIVKLTAIYDKIILKMNVKENKNYCNREWILKKYAQLRKITPKSSLDKTMLKNLDFFEETTKKFISFKVPGRNIAAHFDISPTNVLFKGDRIIALLDFDNLSIRPKIEDVSTIVERTCFNWESFDLNKKKLKTLLEEYEKITPLSKKEKKAIIPLIIIQNCISFWWFHSEMERRPDLKEKILNKITKQTKNLVKELK